MSCVDERVQQHWGAEESGAEMEICLLDQFDEPAGSPGALVWGEKVECQGSDVVILLVIADPSAAFGDERGLPGPRCVPRQPAITVGVVPMLENLGDARE